MDTIFIDSENSKTSEYHVLLLKLVDKINLRGDQKSVALSNLSIYYTWRNIKGLYNDNKFKISAPTWSDEFELPDGSYSISDIQDYFEYILKKPIEIFGSKHENRITFKIKNGYYLELLTPEEMKLLRSTESKITGEKNGENVLHLEVVEVVLIHSNIADNSYQQNSRIFVPNKPFGSLLESSLPNHIFLKTFNSEFQEIKVWFTDQNNNPLEVEDKLNITLIIR